MKDRPILFSAAMVRALLDGTKTQTRRIVKPQPDFDTARAVLGRDVDDSHAAYDPLFNSIGLKVGEAFGFVQPNIACPYGRPGDRLWVRESWRTASAGDDSTAPRDLCRVRTRVMFDAGLMVDTLPPFVGKGRPSIHMPRWASRITLEITGVRVERLQDISSADAIAEGIRHLGQGFERFHPDPADTNHTGKTQDPVLAYRGVWEQINGTGSWDLNPWVWVIEFKRVTP